MIVPIPCQTRSRRNGGRRHIDHYRCDECGNRLRTFTGEWAYCPFCGTSLDMEGLSCRIHTARKQYTDSPKGR